MKSLTLLLLIALLLLTAPLARADVAGQTPDPGSCGYPAVCHWGMVGEGLAAEYWWYSDEPKEPANGSHRHCEMEGAAAEFNGNISLFIFQAGLSAPVGGIGGICEYRCPNNAKSLDPMPDPPALWLLGQKAGNIKCNSVGDPLPLPNLPQGDTISAPPPGAGIPSDPIPIVK